jgi:hypothetical protein
MAQIDKLTFRIRYRWWFRWLFMPMFETCYGLQLMFIDIDAKPNDDWLDKWYRRGVYLEFVDAETFERETGA